MLLLARVVRAIAMLIAGLIVAGILLYVLDANQGNAIVSAITDAARWLVGPFDNMFKLDNAKVERAVNWGIAAAIYAIVGSLIASLIARAATAGREGRGSRFRRRREA